MISIRFPAAVQSAGVPLTVNVKVSQFTPSTQELSPLAAPVPMAVPVQETGELAGPSDPDTGVAEGDLVAKRAIRMSTRPLMTKSVLPVARAIIESESFFIMCKAGDG